MGAAATSALSQLSSLDDILGIGPINPPPKKQVVPTRKDVNKETVNISMLQSSERTQEVCLSVCLSICLSLYLSVSLSVCLSICLSLYLSVCPSLHLSVHLPLYTCAYVYVCVMLLGRRKELSKSICVKELDDP